MTLHLPSARRPARASEFPQARQFDGPAAQTHAARLGMWVFIASELLFFGALFVLYVATREAFPREFAEAARHTDLVLGSANTYVLVTASLLVALALHAAEHDASARASLLLLGAAALGVLFLALKGIEYAAHLHEGLSPGAYFHAAHLRGRGYAYFFTLYYAMTGLHALHVIGGVVVLGVLAWRAWHGAYGAAYQTPLELGGMYWHFVDVVWLFLWPMFYLLR
jgi:cytochrome c oxidase subunit 3